MTQVAQQRSGAASPFLTYKVEPRVILTPVLKGQSLKKCIFPLIFRYSGGPGGYCGGSKITMYIRGLPKKSNFSEASEYPETLLPQGLRDFLKL